MDIDKILDFHRMVMLAASQQSLQDETSCGPLCQHPACWHSKRRQERGVPRSMPPSPKQNDREMGLPTMKCYNMLDDYGESSKDRYPAQYGGRALHDRSSSMRNLSQPLRSASFGITTAPFATPVSMDKTSRSSYQTGMRMVEVQEVFDKDDLNSRWDETFVTRQYLVWVPNPNRKSKKQHLAPVTDKEEEKKTEGKALMPRDLTEAMVPLQIQQEREDTILFDEWPVLKKRQDRSRSPIFQKGTYPRTPVSGYKPDVDSEGVRELLSLPRDVLMQVLDRSKESDFVSREKIHGIIQEVLDTVRDGRSERGRDLSPPHAGRLHTGDVLLQQKAPIHHNKQRNIREAHMMEQRPIFQLDDEDKTSSMDTARDVTDASSTQGTFAKGAPFAKYKQPLPAIPLEDIASPQDTPRFVSQTERKKIPSVSLGLPELPSGLRHTRAFVYNNKHRPDFSLVPVPTPPQSERSSESQLSDHGTTLHVNIPSVSDVRDNEFYARSAKEQRAAEADEVMHTVSPTHSTHVPIAPAGTPATFHTPTRMVRDFTAASSAVQGGENHGVPPSREISMSPGQNIFVPGATSPAALDLSEDPGLTTIKESNQEPQSSGLRSLQQQRSGRNVQFVDSTHQTAGDITRPHAGSPDDWPQVTEPTYDGAAGARPDGTFMTEASVMTDHTSLPRGRSDLSSRGSEHSTLARRILDEGAKVDSPAPPPPSPEPKENNEKSSQRKREDKSRDSNAMEPLIEQSESEVSISPEKNMQGEKAAAQDRSSTQGQSVVPVIQEEVNPLSTNQDPTSSTQPDPVSKVMVSHIAPRPSASREKLQQTFVNVDIPAEDMSSLHAEQGSTPMDITPSLTASPGKNSPTKTVSPKSSAGPGSPSKKSPQNSGHAKKGRVRKNSKGRRGSGEEKRLPKVNKLLL